MSSTAAKTDIVFDGVGRITSEDLIRAIRRRVVEQRIHRDDKLIAHTAALYFQGPAFEWYEDQDEEIQESWMLLRRAILKRWPASNSVPATGPSFDIPFLAAAPPEPPAAAPEPPAAAPYPSFEVPPKPNSIQSSLKHGRLRVESMGGLTLGYLSTKLDVNGHCHVTHDTSEVAIMSLTAKGRLHDMRIMNFESQIVRLGVRWIMANSSRELIEEKATCGALVTITSKGSNKTASSTRYIGPLSSDIWSMSIDNQIFASWEITPRVHRDLTFTYRSALSVTNDLEGFKRLFTPEIAGSINAVKLFFEPVS